MFHSVSLFSQAPLARGSRALPSVLFNNAFYKLEKNQIFMVEFPFSIQEGNFHLKVGGAKSSGNVGDPMLGVAVIP